MAAAPLYCRSAKATFTTELPPMCTLAKPLGAVNVVESLHSTSCVEVEAELLNGVVGFAEVGLVEGGDVLLVEALGC